MRSKVNYILCLFVMCFALNAVAQPNVVDLMCEDTLITKPLIQEVEKYSTVSKLVQKKTKKKEQKKVPKRTNAPNFGGLINNGLVTVLLYLLVAGLLVAVLFILIKHLSPAEVIEKRVVDLDNIEDIAELKVDEELQKALGSGNLRLAVRVQYLRVLQQLSADEAIRWKPKKTNSVYVNEMRSHPLYGIFKMITKNYDFVWYGKREVTQELYQQWVPYFDQFIDSVKPINE